LLNQRALALEAGDGYAPGQMSNPRRTLSLKSPAVATDGPALSSDAELIAQAVRRKLCIVAIYNRTGLGKQD